MPEPAVDVAVDRAAQLLALVLERSPRLPSELAEAVGVARDELGPLLAPLERRELVEWDQERQVLRPGPRERRFARARAQAPDLPALAAPAMRRLADESGETVNLMVASGDGVETIAQESGRHLLGPDWTGREVPSHVSAGGRVLLAFATIALPPGALPAYTPHTVTDREAFGRELAEVARRGYAAVVDELEIGLTALAAPVRDADGHVVAALTASGPTPRLPSPRVALLGRVAIEQAHTISEGLGYRGDLRDLLARA